MKDATFKFPRLQLVSTYNTGIATAAYPDHSNADILLLIKSFSLLPVTIFTTIYKNFALQGFDTGMPEYLLRLIPFDRFSNAVDKTIDYFKFKNFYRNRQYASPGLRSEIKLPKIELSNIGYIERVKDYCKIYMGKGWPVFTLMPLKTLFKKLQLNKSRRIYRSCIAPIAKVNSVNNRRVQLAFKGIAYQ